MKILTVGAELFHVEGRSDMTKLIVTFPNLVNAPNKKIYKVESISDSNSLFLVLSVTLQPTQVIQN
jgi:hypothetical protein